MILFFSFPIGTIQGMVCEEPRSKDTTKARLVFICDKRGKKIQNISPPS